MNVRLPLLPALTHSSGRTLRVDAKEPIEGKDTCGPGLQEALGRAHTASGVTLQVGDLARECGKTVRAIHLYEELGLLTPQGRSKGRYRLYGSTAVVRIRWIGKLQDMGFSLTDIQTLLRDWDDQRSASRTMAKMRAIYAKKLAETQAHIRRLKELEREIVSSLDYLDACDVCDPERLVASCTSCEHHAEGIPVPELVSGYSAAAPASPSSPDATSEVPSLESNAPSSKLASSVPPAAPSTGAQASTGPAPSVPASSTSPSSGPAPSGPARSGPAPSGPAPSRPARSIPSARKAAARTSTTSTTSTVIRTTDPERAP